MNKVVDTQNPNTPTHLLENQHGSSKETTEASIFFSKNTPEHLWMTCLYVYTMPFICIGILYIDHESILNVFISICTGYFIAYLVYYFTSYIQRRDKEYYCVYSIALLMYSMLKYKTKLQSITMFDEEKIETLFSEYLHEVGNIAKTNKLAALNVLINVYGFFDSLVHYGNNDISLLNKNFIIFKKSYVQREIRLNIEIIKNLENLHEDNGELAQKIVLAMERHPDMFGEPFTN